MGNIAAYLQNPPAEFWVMVALVVGFVSWLAWRKFSVAKEPQSDPLQGEFPFATPQNYAGPNPMQGLQDLVNQLEDILRQVYKKLNDRHRDLEQTVTSMEAAMASLEKPFKAVAERCAYGSRLLNTQQQNTQQQVATSALPQPSQPPPQSQQQPVGYSGPSVGYDSPPPGYGNATPTPTPTPTRPQYEQVAEQGARDESYGFRNFPK